MNRTLLLCILGTLTALAAVVNNMFSPAMPAIATTFGIEVPTAQLALTASLLGLAMGQVIIGPLTDRLGRHKPLMMSMVMLSLASVASLLSPSLTVLLALRLLQGLAAGGGIVIARSMASDMSQGSELIKTLAFINVFNGLGPIVTPMLGGALTTSMGWQGPMVGILAIALLLCVACAFVPETLTADRRAGATATSTLSLFNKVFTNRPCIFTILHQGMALAVLFGNIALTPFLVSHYDYSPAYIGYFLGGNGIFTALGAGVAAAMGTALRGMRIASGGLLATSAAMAVVLLGGMGLWAYEVVICLMLFFVGVTLTSSSGHAMDSARAQAGTASALLGAVGFVVGAVVAPLMGLVNLLTSAAIVYASAAVTCAVFTHLAARATAGQRS
ncbi:MAG: MFS transporter [Muribaculaceae bacterium]|nr:MFS transporter [Muribaculaceae bacterium]